MKKNWIFAEGLIEHSESIRLNLQFVEKEKLQWIDNLRKYRSSMFTFERQIVEKKLQFHSMIRSRKVSIKRKKKSSSSTTCR